MDLLWLRVATVLYAGASLAVYPAVLYGFARWRRICTHLGGLGVFFHLVSVVEMLVQAHRWMPVGAREMESLLGFAVAALFSLLAWRYKAGALGIFALPVTFFLVLVPALGPGQYFFPSENVRMGWLVAHIAALLLAYASLLFSLATSQLYLLEERRLKSKRSLRSREGSGWLALGWMPPLETLERIAQGTLEFGFPCMTVGLAIGCVLAQETPRGAAYFLDPKILASFACWAVYVLLLIVRRSAGLRGRRAAYLSGAVFAAMILVWAANIFSQVHRYGAR